MCGGHYSNESGIIKSPSYPFTYPHNANCIYIIAQPNGTYVNISVLNMDIVCLSDTMDYMEMRDGKSEDSPFMGRFCGESNPPASMQTTQNYLMVR